MHCHVCDKVLEKGRTKEYRRKLFCSGRCHNQWSRHHRERIREKREREGLGSLRLWMHSQDLKKEEGGILHKRGWIYIGKVVFGWCYNVGRIAFGADIEVGTHDDDFSIYLAVPGISLWAHLEVPYSWGWGRDRDRRIGIDIHHWAIWWDVWHSTMEWHSGTPRWRNGNFDILDWLLGKIVYGEREIVDEMRIVVGLPEGIYDATIKIVEGCWIRKRWPFPVKRKMATINIKIGVPVAGKGENSYDCGDDAVYGWTGSANGIREAVEKFVKSVAETRQRYGMPSDKAFLDRNMVIPEKGEMNVIGN